MTRTFNWFKAIGFGALIWAIMFALASVLVALGATIGIGWSFMLALAIGLIAYSFGVYANPASAAQGLGYGITFAAVGIVLDYLISTHFHSTIFGVWTYWLGTLLVILAPFVAYELQKTTPQLKTM